MAILVFLVRQVDQVVEVAHIHIQVLEQADQVLEAEAEVEVAHILHIHILRLYSKLVLFLDQVIATNHVVMVLAADQEAIAEAIAMAIAEVMLQQVCKCVLMA